jgi:hypothetical protein
MSLVVFLLGFASVVVSVAWLIADGGRSFYIATLILFFTELGAVVAAAVVSTWRVLLR